MMTRFTATTSNTCVSRVLLITGGLLGVLGLCSVAHADQRPPVVMNHPVVAQRLVVANGQKYPVFLKQGTPLVVERWLSGGGEQYPHFAPEGTNTTLPQSQLR